MHCQICGYPIDDYDELCYYCDAEFNTEPFDLWEHAIVNEEWEEL